MSGLDGLTMQEGGGGGFPSHLTGTFFSGIPSTRETRYWRQKLVDESFSYSRRVCVIAMRLFLCETSSQGYMSPLSPLMEWGGGGGGGK